MGKQNYAVPLLLVGCVVFGLGSLIVKFVQVGPYAVAFWRLLVAAPVFWLLMRRFGQKLPQSRRAVCFALLAGVFLAFDLALWHESIHAVGPGISTLLNSLQIFFLSAIGVAFYGERLNRLQVASLLLAVAGVALIGSPEFGHNGRAVWGFVSGTVSGAMLALSMVFVRKTHEVERVALFPMMMVLSAGGAAALVLPALWFDGGALYPAGWRDVGLVLVYGVVMQCFAWGLIAYAIPLLSLSVTGLLLLSEPVAALLIDYFLLGKPINGWQWAGAGLTLVAIYLGSLKRRAG
ncbi:DMT family transporter [Eikenella sp. S3360]|uniref:DMT family transporter n=1 Tax=Eikenella glucosivorans TaxID=2766967 RepID=A0ABS0ND44_9NEIS|nr:DMT family transporter [Eikenella glucosivorans]MBH5330247.1 DMT family transporter [Eikenella glucosivorans]